MRPHLFSREIGTTRNFVSKNFFALFDTHYTTRKIDQALMIRKFYRLMSITLLAGCQTMASSSINQHKIRDFDGQIIAQIKRGEKLGVVVALIQNGSITYKSYGRRSLAFEGPPDKKCVFEIGSVTKVFNTIVLAKMHLQGRLKISDVIAKHNPLVKWPGAKVVRLEQLATHMSGLPPIFYGDRWQGLLNSRNPFGDFSKDKFLEALLELPVPEPAKTFSFKENYSNIGAALLGMTLSNIDEDSYEGTILSGILKPLGLYDTSIKLSSDQSKRFVDGHDIKLDKTSHWTFQAFAPAGAFHSTAEDLAKFVLANINAYAGDKDDKLMEALRFSHQKRFETKEVSVGLGWFIDGFTNTVFHRGGTFGFTSLVAFNVESKTGVVVLSNTGYEGGKRVFVDGVEEAVFGGKLGPTEH